MEKRFGKSHYIILDFDDTLVKHGFMTKLCFAISKVFHHLAIYFTKPFDTTVKFAKQTKDFVVVTGRTYNDKPYIRQRLNRMGLKPRVILSFPRSKMTFMWKASTLLGFMQIKPILHVDDHVEAVWKDLDSLISQLSDSESLDLGSRQHSRGVNPLKTTLRSKS